MFPCIREQSGAIGRTMWSGTLEHIMVRVCVLIFLVYHVIEFIGPGFIVNRGARIHRSIDSSSELSSFES